MRLRSVIALLIILGLIGGGVYVIVVKPEWVMPYVKQAQREAMGYKPAKTPQEALDRFASAVKDRDYETAATYLSGDYAEQMSKGAKAARSLALAIDNLSSFMVDEKKMSSAKVKLALHQLEPFPKLIKPVEVKESQSGDTATAYLLEDVDAPTEIVTESWSIDPLIPRALVRGWPAKVPVELRKEGDGDAKHWKMYLPMNEQLRLCVSRLVEKGGNYSRGLETFDKELHVEATTMADCERRLKQVIEESK
jgi:hypothetical protein